MAKKKGPGLEIGKTPPVLPEQVAAASEGGAQEREALEILSNLKKGKQWQIREEAKLKELKEEIAGIKQSGIEFGKIQFNPVKIALRVLEPGSAPDSNRKKLLKYFNLKAKFEEQIAAGRAKMAGGVEDPSANGSSGKMEASEVVADRQVRLSQIKKNLESVKVKDAKVWQALNEQVAELFKLASVEKDDGNFDKLAGELSANADLLLKIDNLFILLEEKIGKLPATAPDKKKLSAAMTKLRNRYKAAGKALDFGKIETKLEEIHQQAKAFLEPAAVVAESAPTEPEPASAPPIEPEPAQSEPTIPEPAPAEPEPTLAEKRTSYLKLLFAARQALEAYRPPTEAQASAKGHSLNNLNAYLHKLQTANPESVSFSRIDEALQSLWAFDIKLKDLKKNAKALIIDVEQIAVEQPKGRDYLTNITTAEFNKMWHGMFSEIYRLKDKMIEKGIKESDENTSRWNNLMVEYKILRSMYDEEKGDWKPKPKHPKARYRATSADDTYGLRDFNTQKRVCEEQLSLFLAKLKIDKGIEIKREELAETKRKGMDRGRSEPAPLELTPLEDDAELKKIAPAEKEKYFKALVALVRGDAYKDLMKDKSYVGKMRKLAKLSGGKNPSDNAEFNSEYKFLLQALNTQAIKQGKKLTFAEVAAEAGKFMATAAPKERKNRAPEITKLEGYQPVETPLQVEHNFNALMDYLRAKGGSLSPEVAAALNALRDAIAGTSASEDKPSIRSIWTEANLASGKIKFTDKDKQELDEAGQTQGRERSARRVQAKLHIFNRDFPQLAVQAGAKFSDLEPLILARVKRGKTEAGKSEPVAAPDKKGETSKADIPAELAVPAAGTEISDEVKRLRDRVKNKVRQALREWDEFKTKFNADSHKEELEGSFAADIKVTEVHLKEAKDAIEAMNFEKAEQAIARYGFALTTLFDKLNRKIEEIEAGSRSPEEPIEEEATSRAEELAPVAPPPRSAEVASPSASPASSPPGERPSVAPPAAVESFPSTGGGGGGETPPAVPPVGAAPPPERKKWWGRVRDKIKGVKEAVVNREVGKVTLKVGYDIVTSWKGVKTITDLGLAVIGKGDIATHFKGKKEIKVQRDLIGEAYAKLLELWEARQQADSETAQTNIGTQFKILTDRVQRATHLSVGQKQELLQSLWAVSIKYEGRITQAKADRETQTKQLLEAFIQNKVAGAKLVKDGLNLALTAGGLPMLRGIAYGAMAMIERYQKARLEYTKQTVSLSAEAQKPSEALFVAKDVFINSARETVRALAMQGEKTGASGIQRGVDFVKAVGTVLRGLGIYGVAVATAESPGATVDHLLHSLKQMQEQGVLHAGWNNLKDNADRYLHPMDRIIHPALQKLGLEEKPASIGGETHIEPRLPHISETTPPDAVAGLAARYPKNGAALAEYLHTHYTNQHSSLRDPAALEKLLAASDATKDRHVFHDEILRRFIGEKGKLSTAIEIVLGEQKSVAFEEMLRHGDTAGAIDFLKQGGHLHLGKMSAEEFVMNYQKNVLGAGGVKDGAYVTRLFRTMEAKATVDKEQALALLRKSGAVTSSGAKNQDIWLYEKPGQPMQVIGFGPDGKPIVLGAGHIAVHEALTDQTTASSHELPVRPAGGVVGHDSAGQVLAAGSTAPATDKFGLANPFVNARSGGGGERTMTGPEFAQVHQPLNPYVSAPQAGSGEGRTMTGSEFAQAHQPLRPYEAGSKSTGGRTLARFEAEAPARTAVSAREILSAKTGTVVKPLSFTLADTTTPPSPDAISTMAIDQKIFGGIGGTREQITYALEVMKQEVESRVNNLSFAGGASGNPLLARLSSLENHIRDVIQNPKAFNGAEDKPFLDALAQFKSTGRVDGLANALAAGDDSARSDFAVALAPQDEAHNLVASGGSVFRIWSSKDQRHVVIDTENYKFAPDPNSLTKLIVTAPDGQTAEVTYDELVKRYLI